MTLELHVLGTSSARPSHHREVSGSFLVTPAGNLVIDCGEGFQSRLAAQRRALKSENKRLRSSRLKAVLLTHGHLDHTWGLLPWLKSMAMDDRSKPLMVIGPTSSENLDTLIAGDQKEVLPDVDLVNQYRIWIGLGATTENLGYEIDWVLSDGERWFSFNSGLLECQPQPLDEVEISAHLTSHSVPSFAWKIATPEREGLFDRERAKNLPDHARMSLSQGENIEYEGKSYVAKEFRGEKRSGISIIISGDTAECSINAKCNLLFHEATYQDVHQEWADRFLHSTASGAARTAMQCMADYLAITHYSARIDDNQYSLQEARAVHPSVVACEDGDRLELREDGQLIHHIRTVDGWSISQGRD